MYGDRSALHFGTFLEGVPCSVLRHTAFCDEHIRLDVHHCVGNEAINHPSDRNNLLLATQTNICANPVFLLLRAAARKVLAELTTFCSIMKKVQLTIDASSISTEALSAAIVDADRPCSTSEGHTSARMSQTVNTCSLLRQLTSTAQRPLHVCNRSAV